MPHRPRPATLMTLALLTAGLPGLAEAAKSTFTVVRPTPWGAYNLNPFAPGASYLAPTLSALYETLFFVNILDGKVTPVLGTGYAWSRDNTTLSVKVRPGVRWNDGAPFTARDVAFTFNYLKRYPALDGSAFWKNNFRSVTARGDTVTFQFTKPNTPLFLNITQTPIIPEHVWSKVQDPLTFTNPHPVATGPFTFDTYSQQALRVVKNPNYWMKGQPYVDEVVWVSTTSNEAAQLALLSGKADWGTIGISDPEGGYARRGPQFRYWWPVISTNFLYLNTAKAPFNDPAFRRALVSAINTRDVALKAYGEVGRPATATGLIPAQERAWVPPQALAAAAPYDPAAADQALTAAGYRKDASGKRLGKDGQPLPTFRILVGAGWTDFITMGEVVSRHLAALGIQASVDQQAPTSYTASITNGSYDTAVSWSWGSGPTPYYLYQQSFNPVFSAPVGKTAVSDITRYTDPTVTAALNRFARVTDPAAQKAAIAGIARTVLQNAPWVPLTARTQFNLYNTTRFTNFPDDAHPYNDGGLDVNIGARLLFLNVRPK